MSLQERVVYNKEVQTMVVETETSSLPRSDSSERIMREREVMEEDREAEDRQLEQENAQLEKEIEQVIRGMHVCSSHLPQLNNTIRNYRGRAKQSFQCSRILGFPGTIYKDCSTRTE